MEAILIFMFIVVTLISSVLLYFKRKYTYWKIRNVPYEEPVFPYGNFKGATRTVSVADILDRIYGNCKSKETPFVGVYVFGHPGVLLTDLDLIKTILIKDFNYFTDHGLFYNEKDDPLSAHLFMLDGPEWRSMRNKLSPIFTSGKMKLMFETFVEVGEKLVSAIEEISKTKEASEIKDLMERFTTDVIGSCVFGINCNSFNDPNSEFRTNARRVFTERRNGEIVDAFKSLCPKLARKLGMKLNTDEVIDFFLRIVKETVEYREKHNIVRNDFMSIFMKLKKTPENSDGLTIEQIAAQAFVFFTAGFETSSTTMSFCLYELALNRNIQDKLRQENNSVLEKHNGNVNYTAIMEMTYMEQVINETLRKYAPVQNLLRKCIKDYPVPDTNLVIEKNTMVLVPVHSIQHDPEVYEEPEKFDPERFSSENKTSRHYSAFLPFGDGPRNCIGMRFGLMQVRVGLAFLIRNFYFEDTGLNQSPLQFDPRSTVLSPRDGIYLKIKKIQK